MSRDQKLKATLNHQVIRDERAPQFILKQNIVNCSENSPSFFEQGFTVRDNNKNIFSKFVNIELLSQASDRYDSKTERSLSGMNRSSNTRILSIPSN